MRFSRLASLTAALLLLTLIAAITATAQSGRKRQADPAANQPAQPPGQSTGQSNRQSAGQPVERSDGRLDESAQPKLILRDEAQQQNGASGTSSSSANSSDDDTIKIDTALVTIPVSVIDRDGRYIPNLSKRDFHLYEDDTEQELASFGPVEVPFNVVLLIDTSRSTHFKIEDIQAAAVAFVDQLRAADRVMVVSFDDKIYIDSEFTSDRAQLRRAIYGTRTGGSTKLYDAVDLVVTERLNRVQGRKAIVLFSDGVDTTSKLASARSTVDRVEESDVLVFPIHYDTSGDMPPVTVYGGGNPFPWPGQRMPRSRAPRFPGGRRWPFDPLINSQFPRRGPIGGSPQDSTRGARYMHDLADHSGGRLYEADTLANLSQAFSSIAEELRHQYALGYYPTNTAQDGGFRRIRVRVTQPGAIVRTKAGYRAAGKTTVAKDGQKRPELKKYEP